MGTFWAYFLALWAFVLSLVALYYLMLFWCFLAKEIAEDLSEGRIK